MLLEYDNEQNALRLSKSAGESASQRSVRRRGVIDIGGSGRLIGVEIQPGERSVLLADQLRSWISDEWTGKWTSIDDDGSAYIELSELNDGAFMRSCEVTLQLELNAEGQIASLLIPRHGPDYEISYPSGNR